MEFFDVVDARHSVRAYKKKDIEEAKLRKVLEAANAAPSAGNLQAYEIVVVKSDENKEALSEAAHGQDFIAEAPVVLVFFANPKRCSKYGKRGGELYCIQDATIAAAYTQLAAAALGLGSVWVGAFDADKVAEIVGGRGMKPVAIIPIGYPAEKAEERERRELDDIVHEEKV